MSKKIRIVVLGDLLYDCFIWAERLPRVGETVSGYASGFYAGGKGGNQAMQAVRLGAQTYMIGKVGQDERGMFLLDNLRNSGINAEYVYVDSNEKTGTDCVHIDRQGHNAIIVAPMANERIKPEEIERARGLIESADVFLSQLQVNSDAIEAAMKISNRAGVCTILNPAPAREIPDGLFAMADYCTPNETEAEFFSGCRQEEMGRDEWLNAVTEAFKQKGVRNLIVTLGAAGAWYAGEDGRYLVPPYPVDAVDTTAAGDAFNATLAFKLGQGAGIRKAILWANAAGAITASRMGSFPSMPTLDELEEFLSQRKK
ncbi:MAG: ribokinase [Christensenellales bacterium]|jgi:ribokinase